MTDAAREAALERLFGEAIELRNIGNLEAALAKLDEYEALARGEKTAGDVIRCGILWNLGRLEEAVVAARRVLAVKARHVIASQVLVHALLEARQFDDARTEAERYMTLVTSGEAARAPKSLKDFYADILTATQEQLEGTARSVRAQREARRADGGDEGPDSSD